MEVGLSQSLGMHSTYTKCHGGDLNVCVWVAITCRWISQHFILLRQVCYQLIDHGRLACWPEREIRTGDMESGARDSRYVLRLRYQAPISVKYYWNYRNKQILW